ncbi:MAG: hypothetical protein ABJO01_12715 [Parasphingorhabdus sp.]|uniref:hypothetical protein n=1 Tax=Parasphingorhabdus sp. TaxID=2709688 RepID=UPI003296FF21
MRKWILIAGALIFATLPLSDGLAQIAEEKSDPSPALAGSYRLVGAMETASRLLVEVDGSYKWNLIVGAADFYSEGRWTQIGDEIRLGPHEFSADMPVFQLGTAYDWGFDERDSAYRMTEIRQRNRAKWRCGFLESGAYFSSRDDDAFPHKLPPQKRFEAAKKIEAERLLAYENAIARYLNRDPSDKKDTLEISARTARQKWEDAVAFLAQSGRTANLIGRYRPPALPAECLFLSDYVPNGSAGLQSPQANWQDGVGVWINRRDRPNARLNIDADFSFADGSKLSANSYELGFAFASGGSKSKLQNISLTLHHNGAKYHSTFDMDPQKTAKVFEVKLDNRVFIEPPFEELRLKISGNKLLPVDGSRGHYIKNTVQ